MHIAKRALLFVLTLTFGLFLLILIATTIFSQTLGKPDKIKGWIEKSNVYSRVVPAILETAQKDSQEKPKRDGSDMDIDFTDPEVQKIAQDALSPEFIRQNTERVIDSTFEWLNGEIEKPDFAIDVSEVKSRIATGVGDYLRKRSTTLPLCTQLPEEIDLFNATCIPPGVNIEAEIQKLVQEINGSKEFLSESTITADTISKERKADSDELKGYDFFRDGDGKRAQRAFSWIKRGPIIFGLLSLVTAVGIILLNESKRRGLRHIMITLFTTGGLLLVSIWLITIALNAAKNKLLSNNAGTKLAALQQGALDGFEAAHRDISRVSQRFGIAFIVIGLGIAVYLFVTRNKTHKLPVSSAQNTDAKPVQETSKPEEEKKDLPNSPT